MPEKLIFYRYQIKFFDSTAKLDLKEYEVYKATPKGFWIAEKTVFFFLNEKNYKRRCKWVSADQRKTKAFARLDKNAALEDIYHRYDHYLWHLENRTEKAKKGLFLINKKREKGR